MPQLEQTEFFLSQLFWLVMLFVVLFVVLTYFTLPKIRTFLNKRDTFINDHLSKQDDLIKKAEIRKIQFVLVVAFIMQTK